MDGHKRKGKIDPNDWRFWGYRFDLRERASVQVKRFNPEDYKHVPKPRVQHQPRPPKAPREPAEPAAELPVPAPIKRPAISKAPVLKKKFKSNVEAVVRILLEEMTIAIERGEPMRTFPSSYINCDIRYYNIDFIVEKYGLFDVVVIDPPWRIRGGQRNSDSPFMFSNSTHHTDKFTLEYDTMSNQEVMDIPIEKLSKRGFCFLWILAGTMDFGYQCLNKWGYECVDRLVWVKTTKGGRRAKVSHGFYFLHSTETCLVGYKCPAGETVSYRPLVSNDLLIADVRKKSQKPDQLYTVIDLMMPGAKKIEIFARNNNLREGWLSLGNQIVTVTQGEVFEKWRNELHCDQCRKHIEPGKRRWKSKKVANFDICERCITDVLKERTEAKEDFYVLENPAEEEVLHHYHRCDHCGVEPIWGTRFKCLVCDNIDLCENCLDKVIESKTGCAAHAFLPVELPIVGHGLPVHVGKRCVWCLQKPILGPCFICADCNHLVLCQNCFFNATDDYIKVKGHETTHKIEIMTLSSGFACEKCTLCSKAIRGKRFKCLQCADFALCEMCYMNREEATFTNGHQNDHSYTSL